MKDMTMLKVHSPNEYGTRAIYHNNGVFVGECIYGDDGYYYWWPNKKLSGFVSAEYLRELADILDNLNKDWDEQVRKDLSERA